MADLEKNDPSELKHSSQLPSTSSDTDSTLESANRPASEKTDEVLPPPPQVPSDPVVNGDPPPNGGSQAWLIVLGSFFLFFNSWGTVNSFGEFQTYYRSSILQNESPDNISWIGSIQSFLLLFIGVVTGPLYDAGHFRLLISAGAFLVPFGFFMTSICTQYWQFILAQGICVGLGNGCLFVPSIAILPQYFTTKKALANGLAASGSSLGGVLYPIIFHRLVARIGFGWTTRLMGFISLTTCLISVLIMKPRVLPQERRALLHLSAFREPPYLLFCIALPISFIGFYGPVFYMQTSALDDSVPVNLAFYLLPIFNAASIPGRILPNFVADSTGPLNILVPASLATAALALAWIGIHSSPGYVVFALLYGFFSGGFISLPPVALVWLTPDLRTVGTRMGMCFGLCSLGLLIGAPSSGAILQHTGRFLGTQLFSGCTLMVTAILLVVTRVVYAGFGLRVKA